jgi:tetratricopeptide (TPR) repeat protein
MGVVAIGAWAVWARTTPEVAPHQQAAHYAVLGRAVLDREHTARANKEALVLFDKALALDPNSTLALLGYARVMLVDVTDGWAPPEEHAARLSQAEVAIERTIKLDPKHARAYLQRGFLWRARADPGRALAAFQDALALDPHYAWAHAEAGRTKIELGRSDEAIKDMEIAIRLAPTEPRLFNWYYWLGMAAVHAGKSDVAIDWLLKVRREDPLYYRLAMPWLAIAYADVDREEEARALMAEYLVRNPSYGMAGWRKAFPNHTPSVAKQRHRMGQVLERLGVPDGRIHTGSVR